MSLVGRLLGTVFWPDLERTDASLVSLAACREEKVQCVDCPAETVEKEGAVRTKE